MSNTITALSSSVEDSETLNFLWKVFSMQYSVFHTNTPQAIFTVKRKFKYSQMKNHHVQCESTEVQ